MKAWQAFLETCAHLRAGLLGERPVEECKAPWSSVVEVSNLQLVSPALAWCLKDRSDLPTEVREYFEGILWLNSRREKAILDALEPALRTLTAAGVEPILLKGAAHLVEGLYPPGARLVGDVDVLIASDLAERATRSLVEAGYEISDDPLPDGHRHLPVLHDGESGLAIELHTRIEQEVENPVLPLSWFMAKSRSVRFRRLDVRLPDPTRLAAHNFVHHRVNDIGRPSPVELRWLLDMALIMARHDGAIDWSELDHYCVRAGQGEVLATYLAFGETLLGRQAPALTARPDNDAVWKLREYVDPAEGPLGRDLAVVLRRFSGTEAVHVAGHCWRVPLPNEFLPDDFDVRGRFTRLELLEDGEPLGPAFAGRSLIERMGRGSFSHQAGDLFFSTSDNSDPRISNRTYLLKVPTDLREMVHKLETEKRALADELDDMKASMFWRLRLRFQQYPRTYRGFARLIRAMRGS